jgi:fluoride exporter
MKLLIQYLAVAGAGAAGAVLRVFVGSVCSTFIRSNLPVATFVINISGSLLLGWFLAITRERMIISDTMRLAVGAGFVGAYTTFSTFMYESNALFENGASTKALAYLIGSLVVGLIAIRFGLWLGGR